MARNTFRGIIPQHLLYDTEYDMWVRRDGEEVVIGATSFGIFLAGEIIAFTAKPSGAECAVGRGLGTVECAKTVLAVHAPLSFILKEGNAALEERPAMLNTDPYELGWMVRGTATAWEQECSRLVDAQAYQRHVLRLEPAAEFL